MEARRLDRLLPQIGLFCLSFYILTQAWVAEDAYITFRVIDNFLHGNGLRWNVYERVQAYTHPLWMLLHVPLTLVLTNIYYASILLCIGCTGGALWLTFRTAPRPGLAAFALLLLPLALSRAFIDYAASGLENPLGFLLFACFGHVLLHYSQHPRFWLYATLCVALAGFNRLDHLLFYLPALAGLWRWQPQALRWRQVVLGALPLLLWLAFSLWYYGFLFPNTRYAKLGTGLGAATYLSEGTDYLRYLVVTDLPSFLPIALAGAMVARRAQRFLAAPAQMPWLPRALALGMLLYCAYVVCVGGDYMAGRFWASCVFVGVWMLYHFLPNPWQNTRCMVVILVLAMAYFPSVIALRLISDCNGKCYFFTGNIIEAAEVFKTNRLIPKSGALRIRSEGEYIYAERGRNLAAQAAADPGNIWRLNLIGMTGYYAGINTPIIDTLGLADPLLARLPAVHEDEFLIGHYRRDIPKGYTHFLRSGSTEEMDPDLAGYYAPLQKIVAGDLFDASRLKTIILFNIGYYDHFKEAYLAATH